MKWFATTLLCMLVLAGCNSHTPSFKTSDLLSPYGSSRVPPPATNGYQTGSAYYNNANAGGTVTPTGSSTFTPTGNSTTAPPTVQGVPTIRSGQAAAGTPQQAPVGNAMTTTVAADGKTWEPVQSGTSATSVANGTSQASGVVPASFESASPTGGTTSSGSQLRLKGMPINDATPLTASNEPARFSPPPEAAQITQLPSPNASTTVVPTGTVVATSKSSDSVKPLLLQPEQTPGSTLQWRSREEDK